MIESNILVPLLAGLVGAIVGALSSVLTIWIQQNGQSRRDKMRIASELAKSQYEFTYEHLKDNSGGKFILPLCTFQHMHFEILTALENNELSEQTIKEIYERNEKLEEAIIKYSSHV